MGLTDPYGLLGQQQNLLMNNIYGQLSNNIYNGYASSVGSTITISPTNTTFTYEPLLTASVGVSGDPKTTEQRWLDRRIDEMRVRL
jgi:hypothetical protein